MIVTFYSYKGGVGRTMALANVACLLANRHGWRVAAIDWDLEAPGLHFYFGHRDASLSKGSGLIDLLIDQSLDREVELDSYLTSPSKAVQKRIVHGEVQLITCGRLDASYMERVAEFNWA